MPSQRGFKGIKGASGDNPSFANLSVQESSGSPDFKFVLAKRSRKGPIDVATAPPRNLRSDIDNHEEERKVSVPYHEQPANGAAEVFNLPLSHEQVKADPGVENAHQLLDRQGKVSGKKAFKTALYYETEESQIQQFPRQQRETKSKSRQGQAGGTRAAH